MAYSSDTASGLFLHALLRSYVETVSDHPTDESAADAGKQGAFRVTVADIPLVRDAVKNGAEQDAKMAFTAYTVACVGGMRLLNLAQNALFEAGGADVLSKFIRRGVKPGPSGPGYKPHGRSPFTPASFAAARMCGRRQAARPHSSRRSSSETTGGA